MTEFLKTFENFAVYRLVVWVVITEVAIDVLTGVFSGWLAHPLVWSMTLFLAMTGGFARVPPQYARGGELPRRIR